MKKTVGILLFNEVEVLDFAGPFEVFAVTEDLDRTQKLFNVITISEKGTVISARNGLKVIPDYSFHNAPSLDLLIVPGGYGAEKIEIENITLLNWIKEKSTETEITASVCTGAFLLAKSGVLTTQSVTTHWMDVDELEKTYPSLNVVRNVKYVDQETTFTSGGISAGIVMSLAIVAKLSGKDVAAFTAKRMEYDWHPSD